MKWSFQSADAAQAYLIRADLTAYLRARATDESDLDGATLVFGELVGNVVRHAPGAIAVDVHWENGEAVLCVRDSGPGFEWDGSPELPPDSLAESGRGLYISRTISNGLEVRRLPEGGTQATARLPVARKNGSPAG